MKKSGLSNIDDLNNFNDMNENYEKYKIEFDEIINIEDISKNLMKNFKCSKCKREGFIKIKKFKSLDKQLNLEELNDDFGRCSCGKRHIDIVMAQILKIMKERNINLNRFILRNGPIPLITPMFNGKNEPFIEKNSLIILHSQFTKDIAEKIMNEVSEVKGVIKGDPKETVGLIESDSEAICYELLAGSDLRCDIVQTPVGKIVINKIQHLSYLEFPPSMENKIKKLWEYMQMKKLSPEKISNLTVLDGTCGNGTLGIFLLKLGVKKVIFNDIWKPSTVMTSININANGFPINEENNRKNGKQNIDYKNNKSNFEVYNMPFEKLNEIFSKKIKNKKMYTNNIDNDTNNTNNNVDYANNEREIFDICILDCFPGTITTNLEKVGKKLAKNLIII